MHQLPAASHQGRRLGGRQRASRYIRRVLTQGVAGGGGAGVPMDKVYVNVDRFGNTSAASIAIALDEAVKTGRLKPGMVVMLCAFGAGFTWGSMVVRW